MNKSLIKVACAVIFLTSPLFVLAQDNTRYNLLAPLPGVGVNNSSETTTASDYIAGIFKLIIAIAGALAVIRLIMGGIQYMASESIGGKGEAKKTIQGALGGLILVMSSWLILNTINPKLVEFNLEIPKLKVGGDFSTNLGRIPTAEALNCGGCVLLKESPYTVLEVKNCDIGCYAKKELADKLVALAAQLKSAGINWRITEAYPPSVKHSNPCHVPNNPKTGTCVDVNLTGAHTANDVRLLLFHALGQGLRPVYEVETIREQNTFRRETRLNNDSLIKAVRREECESGEDPGLIGGRYTVCCPPKQYDDPDDTTCSWITAPHFSIYLP